VLANLLEKIRETFQITNRGNFQSQNKAKIGKEMLFLKIKLFQRIFGITTKDQIFTRFISNLGNRLIVSEVELGGFLWFA
jgi:hypothetical protein